MLESWKTFLSKKATWAIVAVNFVNHWSYFILLNWMPSYFVRALGLDLRASSFLSFLPWIVLAVGSTLAGEYCAVALVAPGHRCESQPWLWCCRRWYGSFNKRAEHALRCFQCHHQHPGLREAYLT